MTGNSYHSQGWGTKRRIWNYEMVETQRCPADMKLRPLKEKQGLLMLMSLSAEEGHQWKTPEERLLPAGVGVYDGLQ